MPAGGRSRFPQAVSDTIAGMSTRIFHATGTGRTSRLGSIVVSTVLLLASGTEAGPETMRSYDYRLILRVAPHRLLTPAFRNQLRSDLQYGIQSALKSFA